MTKTKDGTWLLKVLKREGYNMLPGSAELSPAAVGLTPAAARKLTELKSKRPKPQDYATVLRCRFPDGAALIPWASERAFSGSIAKERNERAVLKPEYRLLHHCPNENSHHEPGVLAGVPDWHWPLARGGYIGFWCEIKVGDNTPSDAQVEVMHLLESEGHYCVVIWDDAAAVFEETERYLAL